MMLVSDWIEDWSLYKHAEYEHEASLAGVHDAVVGRQPIAVIHLQREDGRNIIMRMQKREAKRLGLLLSNLYPSVIGDH